MKVEINDDTRVMSIKEVAEELKWNGALNLDSDERMGDARLECGCDLEIDIMTDDAMDRRIDGCLSRTETFTLNALLEEFSSFDYCTWAKDENGDDILLCFGFNSENHKH